MSKSGKPTQKQGDVANPTNKAAFDPLKKEKKKIQRTTLKPDHLMSTKGIPDLYDKALKLKLSSKDEIKNFMEIMNVLRTWHKSLMPKYSLELFFSRVSSFGNNKLIQFFMKKARRVHQGKDSWFDENRDTAKEQNNQSNQNVSTSFKKKEEDNENFEDDVDIDYDNNDYDDEKYDNGQQKGNLFGTRQEIVQNDYAKERGIKSVQLKDEQPQQKTKMVVTKLEDSGSDDDDLTDLMNKAQANVLSGNKVNKVLEVEQEYYPPSEDQLNDYIPPGFDDDYQ